MIRTEPHATARWELTAPESFVLRNGPYGSKPAEVIKLAVLELVTRRVLRLVEVESRDRRGGRTTEMVIGAGGRPAPLDGPLAPVAKIALEASAQTYPDGTVGLSIPGFAKAFVAKHGNLPHRYILQSVLPALEARGLFAGRQGTFFRIFPHKAWTRTPEGEVALARLAEITETAEREVSQWLEREPKRVASFLALAGAAALLVPAAYPAFEELARRLHSESDDGGIVPLAIILGTVLQSPDAEPDEQGTDAGQGTDVGGLDFSVLSLDFSGFAGLDGAFAGIDAGIDAGTASADGGGGGGGGD